MTANDLVKQILAELPNTQTHMDPAGQTRGTAREGNRVIHVRPCGPSEVRVTLSIDYGDYGLTCCDGRDYRSVRGAVRFARAGLKLA